MWEKKLEQAEGGMSREPVLTNFCSFLTKDTNDAQAEVCFMHSLQTGPSCQVANGEGDLCTLRGQSVGSQGK